MAEAKKVEAISMSNPYKQYQKTQVTTASRGKILLMLYEGAIRFTKQAQVSLENKKISEKGKYVSKATAILAELMATLDFKAGGQLAVDLENLYVFMIDRMIEGNMKNDIQCFKDVEKILMTLYTAWKDVVNHPRGDGIPSKEMQPEEFKKWMEIQAKNAEENQPAEKNLASTAKTQAKDGPRLKLIA